MFIEHNHIIKESPEPSGLNPTPLFLRQWASERAARRFDARLFMDESSPETHPDAIDLFSGDGRMARVLIENNWDPTHIVCADWRQSPTPLVTGVRWVHANLETWADLLLTGAMLPPELGELHAKFDIVVSSNSMAVHVDKVLTLHKFLLAPHGHEYHF